MVSLPNRIRPIVICLFRHAGRILAAEGLDDDPSKPPVFYRPLGGEIKFGETAADALVREIREELGAEITDIRYLGAMENLFRYRGAIGHEIALVFDARFADDALYNLNEIRGQEDDEAIGAFRAVWVSVDDVDGTDRPPLYPTGLLESVRRWEAQEKAVGEQKLAPTAKKEVN